MRCAARTDRGRVRELNEDSYLVEGNIVAVADGMGGHQAGEVASATALREVVQRLKSVRRPRRAIRQAFELANQLVLSQSAANATQSGMGTTLTLALICRGELWLGHIGDSRAYLWRQGKLVQLTQDHSLVADLVRSGKLPAEQAATHPRRHIITRAIGGGPRIKPDIMRIPLGPGDRLLLCTDGLTNVVSDEEIERVAAGGDVATACQQLIERANAGGGPDNITAVLVEVETPPPRPTVWISARLWLTMAVAVVGLLALVANYWLGGTFYLGARRGRVAVYRGVPISIAGYRLYALAEPTRIRLSNLPSYYQKRLDQGIVVGTWARVSPALKDVENLRKRR